MKKIISLALTFAMLLSSAAFLLPVGADEYDSSKVFVDVPSDAWFKESVDFVGSRGIMGGAGQADTFKPSELSTRSMITVILHRLEGEPGVNTIPSFTDLSEDWYMSAIEWAYEFGVVKGSSETTFNPNGNVTRQELVTMIYRFIKTKRVDMSIKGNIDSFDDGGEVADWAKEAVEWALGVGLISGRSDGGRLLLAPKGYSQRCELATVFMRLTEKYEEVFGMTVYYVSADGDNSNNGLSEETPFKTIKKASSKISEGDIICLKRGDTFYEGITTPIREGDRPTLFTTYGEGEKPVVSRYKIAKKGVWEDCGNGVWRVDLTNRENYTGDVTSKSVNVGFINVSGEIYARNAFSVEALKDQWDFHWEDKYVYVKSSKCPDELSDDIRFALEGHCVKNPRNVIFEDIVFQGSGSHGMAGTWSNALVRRCEFRELGGSRLEGHSEFTRYGNGVECWSDSENVIIEDCYFTNIYDVAMTMQGGGITFGWRNITFRNNTVENCQQAFEIWANDDIPGAGFINCAFVGNVCRNSGYGWSYEVRPDKTNGSHLLMYNVLCPVVDIQIKGNTFDKSISTPIFKSQGPSYVPDGYVIEDNKFIMHEDQNLINRDSATDEEMNAFADRIKNSNTVEYVK